MSADEHPLTSKVVARFLGRIADDKNRYSVKCTMYPKNRARDVDGPWKPSVDAAVTAFADMLKKKGLDGELVFRPFIAEKTDEKTAPSRDGRGNSYKVDEEATKEIYKALEKKGLRVQ